MRTNLLIFLALALGLNAHAADFGKLESDLSSDNGQVVLAALKELKVLGPAGTPAVPAVVGLLKKKKNYPWSDYGLDNVVYPAAFETLKASGVKSDAVLDVSLDYFKNASVHLGVKPYALDLIADYGDKAAPVIPLLAAQLDAGSTRSTDQRRILAALERIGPAAAPATIPLLLDIAARSPLGSDRIQALSALSRIAPKDKRVLKAYAEAACKRPGSSEDEKLYGLFSDYLSKCGKLDKDDLAVLAGYMDRYTKREAAEDRNPPGHITSVNPNYMFVARLFLDYPERAGLIMPSLAERIRQTDMHMKDFKVLLNLAGEFGATAAPLVPAIYERASSRERVMFGFLKPGALKALNEIGTPAALEKAKLLSARR